MFYFLWNKNKTNGKNKKQLMLHKGDFNFKLKHYSYEYNSSFKDLVHKFRGIQKTFLL